MLCSNCKIVDICLRPHESSAICENGHNLCGNCLALMSNKCALCDGRMLTNYENAWSLSEEPNWTQEMMRDWALQNECMDSASVNYYDRSEDFDSASMNILYSKGHEYEAESPQQSDISESNRIQPLSWKDMLSKGNDHYSKSSSNQSSNPKHYKELTCLEDKSGCAPVRKDTRQKLVDEKKQEIRKKIMEEIFKSFKDDPRSHFTPQECLYVKKYQTIGVSTESTPRLIPEESLHSRSIGLSHESIAKNSKIKNNKSKEDAQQFLVMNVETSDISNPKVSETVKKKLSSSCIDLKLQQIMGTILESVGEKPDEAEEDHHFYKYIREKFSHVALSKLEQIISSIHNEVSAQVCSPCQSNSTPKRSTDLHVIPNSLRAYYNPPLTNQPDIAPNPQYQIITLSNSKVSRELSQIETIDASTLCIPRSPVICPISTCQRAFFISDFTKHVAVDHTKVPIERIFPRHCKNFFLDPKLIHFGVSRCHVLLLVKDKIINLGHEKFKDFIPVLLMTTKVSLLELCRSSNRPSSEELKKSKQNFIMIWLTGITPPQLPIFFSLTFWARTGYMPTCHLVHSGRLYSVRNSQSPEAVLSSGQMVLLSENQVDLLTNRGRQMLELQIAVH